MDSMISKGLPYDPDMFSHGENPHGCGHAPRTVYKGIRTTGADFITKDRERENITLKTETTVDRVILERDSANGLKAKGVVVVGRDGTQQTFYAKKEIVISGGAYCSPAILLRSGIGPKEDLEKLGIPCQVDLPGVGKNLLDHLVSIHSSTTKQALFLF